MIQITILGSGTCVPTKRRGTPGIAIRSKNSWILVDGGSGSLSRMASAGIDYTDVDYVLYTHIHPDHTLDIVSLLFAINYTPGYKRERPLDIIGPKGFKQFFEDLSRPYPWIRPKDFPMDVMEVTDEYFSVGYLGVQASEVNHGTLPSVAYRFTNDAETMVISGDTAFCDEIVDLSRKTDLLLCEASFPTDEFDLEMHLSASLAGKVASLAQVKNLALYHFYPVCDEYDMKTLCAKEYDGRIIITEDLMKLEISQETLRVINDRTPENQQT